MTKQFPQIQVHKLHVHLTCPCTTFLICMVKTASLWCYLYWCNKRKFATNPKGILRKRPVLRIWKSWQNCIAIRVNYFKAYIIHIDQEIDTFFMTVFPILFYNNSIVMRVYVSAVYRGNICYLWILSLSFINIKLKMLTILK